VVHRRYTDLMIRFIYYYMLLAILYFTIETQKSVCLFKTPLLIDPPPLILIAHPPRRPLTWVP
jgi:hypothetical protein